MKLFTRVTLMCFLAVSVMAQRPKSPANMSGHVTDFFGQPLPGASVELSAGGAGPQFSVVTDARGGYRFSGIPAGEYDVVVSLKGFRREASRVNLLESESELLGVGLEVGRLTDVPPTEVAGVVRQGGRSLPGATVILTNAFNRRESHAARTDRTGRYAISVNNPGQYIVQASRPGSTVDVKSVVVTPWALRRHAVDLSLSPLRLPRADGFYGK